MVHRREIGIGVLGWGFMGNIHTHSYRDMPFLFSPLPATPKLVAVCDVIQSKLDDARERFAFSKSYTDWRRMIEDDTIDIVSNAFPNNLHYEPSKEAARLGKHIVCEKPLAMNYEQTRDLYETARKAKVKHMTAFKFREIPAIQLAKKLLDEGFIGDIFTVKAEFNEGYASDMSIPLNWTFKKKMSGGGALQQLGPHSIDIVRFLVGEVTKVFGLTETYIKERRLPDKPQRKGRVDVDDVALSLVRFANGATGSLAHSRISCGHKVQLYFEINGSEGSLVYDVERLNELRIFSRKDPELRRGFKTIRCESTGHQHDRFGWWPTGEPFWTAWEYLHMAESFRFIDAIINNKPFSPSFYDGMRAQLIIDSIMKSSERESWVAVPN